MPFEAYNIQSVDVWKKIIELNLYLFSSLYFKRSIICVSNNLNMWSTTLYNL